MNKKNFEGVMNELSKKAQAETSDFKWCLYLRKIDKNGNGKDAAFFIPEENGLDEKKIKNLAKQLLKSV